MHCFTNPVERWWWVGQDWPAVWSVRYYNVAADAHHVVTDVTPNWHNINCRQQTAEGSSQVYDSVYNNFLSSIAFTSHQRFLALNLMSLWQQEGPGLFLLCLTYINK